MGLKDSGALTGEGFCSNMGNRDIKNRGGSE